jgi:hypothetical protein
MFITGKKCWAGSVKKWLLENRPQEVAGSLPPIQLLLETASQLAATRAFQARIAPRTMHIHPTHLVGVKGWPENQMLWCNTHNIQVEVRMAKLAMLQLVQPVGAKCTTKGPINQKVGAPPLPGFPHTMLSVKRVKHNMRLAFIEKFFTNYKIGTSV